MSIDDLSDEEKALFRANMKGVKPLNKSERIFQLPPVTPAMKRPKTIHANKPALPQLSDFYEQSVGAETVLSYQTPHLPSARFKLLKRGLLPWQGRLDLHGLTLDKARDRLLQFIQSEVIKGARVLLIIHGKGSLDGTDPVLKNAVNTWLKQLPNVLAFHSAISKDGGTGAVYLMLKRVRDF